MATKPNEPSNGHERTEALPATVPLTWARRERWVPLPDPDGVYKGWQIKLWVNPPVAMRMALTVDEPEKRIPAIQAMVLEHNGWVQPDGSLVPPVTDIAGFWDAIPTDIGMMLVQLAFDEAGKHPNLPAAKRDN
jgi:hypothetical protein